MPTTPPPSLPRWADSAAPGDIVDPPSAKKDVGWNTQGEKPPRNFVNWFWNLVYQWLLYISIDLTRLFDNMTDLIDAGLAVGQSAIVGFANQPWTEAWSVTHLNPATYDGGVVAVECTGRLVFASVFSLSGAPAVNKVYCHDALDGVERWNNDVTGSSAALLTTDGLRVFYTDNSLSIMVRDKDDTLLSTMNLAGGGFITAMATDGANLYIAREVPVTSITVEAYNATTYSTTALWTWTGAVGITVNDLATDGENVFLCQEYDGGGGDTVKQLRASDGVEITGVNLDSTHSKAIASDGEYLYVCTDFGVYSIPGYVGDPGENVLKNTQVSQDIAVSPRYMCTAMKPGSMQSAFRVARKRSLLTARQVLWQSASQSNPTRAIAVDTRMVFIGGYRESGSGSDKTLIATHLPGSPMKYRQAINTDTTRQYHNLTVVPET